ncbi:MAG: serine/threonine protein kinase [Sandaracinus sp.]|nr:serine/threonine protein kinase [Sandaracinus sp.]
MAEEPQQPERFGDFEVVGRLGAGGMATLYVARRADAEQPTPVAIKVVHQHLSSDWEAMRWFIDEALISIRIRHPNVVRVDELGEQGGLYYLVMEYVHGASLAQMLAALGRQGKRLDPWLSAWVVARIAEGLHAAHELRGDEGELLGVIHRDISPQNVLVSHEGEVKLVDFGIAKARGRAERTREGELRGKIRYLAPEQVAGAAQDRRVDLFALGVVLWEMLTQRRLYASLSQDELLEAIRDPRAERPSLYQQDIPPGLEGFVLNCIAAKPEERPQTAEVMRNELEEVLRNAPPEFDGQRALSALIQDVLGETLLASLRAMPPELAQAAGIDLVEPTIPRVRRDETGKLILPAEPVPVPVPEKKPAGGSRTEVVLWVVAVIAALGAFVGAAWFLLSDG